VCTASTSFTSDPAVAILTITKSANIGTTALKPGDSLSCTITVTNLSATTTGHGTVTDAVPAGLLAGSWTASAGSGSTVTPTSGTGLISASVTVAPHGHVTFTRSAQIDPAFDSSFDPQNVATLSPGANSSCSPTKRSSGLRGRRGGARHRADSRDANDAWWEHTSLQPQRRTSIHRSRCSGSRWHGFVSRRARWPDAFGCPLALKAQARLAIIIPNS
jgi:uncharacterized repeat protein (TIGR01451 family)